jgi:hypothetical protein
MQIRATIIKLLLHYTPDELLGHIAHEIEQQAVSYANAGASVHRQVPLEFAEATEETKGITLHVLGYRRVGPTLKKQQEAANAAV